MNPSLNKTKLQTEYQIFFSYLVCLSENKLIFIPCSAVLQWKFNFGLKLSMITLTVKEYTSERFKRGKEELLVSFRCVTRRLTYSLSSSSWCCCYYCVFIRHFFQISGN